MKLPGRAWLEFEVEPTGRGSIVRQTAEFDPAGVAGQAYWYLIYPLHQFVFAGMLKNIVNAGIQGSETKASWNPSLSPVDRYPLAIEKCVWRDIKWHWTPVRARNRKILTGWTERIRLDGALVGTPALLNGSRKHQPQ